MARSGTARSAPEAASLPLRSVFLFMFFFGAAAVGSIAALGVFDHSAGPQRVDPRVRDRSKVYFGKPHAFQSPAVIELKKIYPAIPAYQRIQREGLGKSDARYHLLMEKATKLFRRRVARVAKTKKHDLVAEVGALAPPKNGKPYPNLTDAVLATLGQTP